MKIRSVSEVLVIIKARPAGPSFHYKSFNSIRPDVYKTFLAAWIVAEKTTLWARRQLQIAHLTRPRGHFCKIKMHKRRLYSSFVRDIIEEAVQPRCLVHHKWLDFACSPIEWDIWEPYYKDTIKMRRERNALYIIDKQLSTLVELTETILRYNAENKGYFGSVELQLLTNSLISFRLNSPMDNVGLCIHKSLEDLVVGTIRTSRFVMMLGEIIKRVDNLHSPVVDGEILCYPIGHTFGLDAQTSP